MNEAFCLTFMFRFVPRSAMGGWLLSVSLYVDFSPERGGENSVCFVDRKVYHVLCSSYILNLACLTQVIC